MYKLLSEQELAYRVYVLDCACMSLEDAIDHEFLDYEQWCKRQSELTE